MTKNSKIEQATAKAAVVTGSADIQAKQAAPPQTDLTKLKVEKGCSRGFGPWLAKQNLSVAITSYQSGRLYLVGSEPQGKVSFYERIFERAMGVVGNHQRIFLGGLFQLWRFENVLRKGELANKMYDRCYVPRNAQTIGDLDIHELGIRKNGKVVFVNTKYSCLAELDPVHSFKAIWKPPFISKLAPEDRCHLNGLAMKDGEPKYASAVCKSDTVDGWRDRRGDGGVILDVETDEIVCEGLSMPHSPRWHNGKLWVLNAGTGYLGWVDFENKKFVPFTFCPGFLRGLAMHGDIAAIGLSKPRNKRFEGLELDGELAKRDADPWCGVQFVSLTSGDVLHWIRFEGDLNEVFDVSFLPGVRNPMLVGLRTSDIRELITFESAIKDVETTA